MKHFIALLLAAFAAQPLFAQNVVTGDQAPNVLYSSSGATLTTAADFAACAKEAAKQTPGAYVCQSRSPLTITAPQVFVDVWVQVAIEGSSFTLAAPAAVRYGDGTRSTVKDLASGLNYCNNGGFAGDPAPGKPKLCEMKVTVPETSPFPPVPVLTWTKVADENGQFTLTATTVVRYGADTRTVTKAFGAGSVDCTNGTFGDPALGTVKVCEVQSSSPGMPDHSGRGPAVNPALIPPDGMAFTDARIRSTWHDPNTGAVCEPFAVGCVVSDHEKINSSDIGAFREPCAFSHMNFDDPIVYPGKPGAAHMHTYFGNSATDANSTQESLAAASGSTCAGGILNRSAYWVPTLIDTSVGKPIVPGGLLVYYKGNYQFDQSKLVEPYPAGLRMIAGSAKNMDPTKTTAHWECYGPNGENPGTSPSITDAISKGSCLPGGTLSMSVPFPICWNGVDLDSPDHSSHMSYMVFFEKENRFGCPATHPRVLPNMSFNIGYAIHPGDNVSKWRLSSDSDPAAPAGVTAHGDYWFNWDNETNKTWTKNCLTNKQDGHAYLLCDGRTLF